MNDKMPSAIPAFAGMLILVVRFFALMPQETAVQIPSPETETPATHPAFDSLPETVISSDSKVQFVQALKDLWNYRDLFRAFVTRDIKVRYKQTALGAIWVLLQPILVGGILAFVFNNIGKQTKGAFEFSPLWFMAGLVAWTSFATAVQNSAMSMETNANMISKVYFPRMVIPGAYVVGSALDFFIAFGALIAMAIAAGKFSLLLLVAMPLLLIVQMMAALGLGLFFGALNAQYHDVKYVLPFMLQVGMLVSVLITLSEKTVLMQHLFCLNPMAPVIDTYRAILNNTPINMTLLGQGVAISLLFFIVGAWFFRAREAKMMDIL